MVATRGGAGVARVFVTGSSDGLGLMTARLLVDQGHEVVLHGRNEGRSREALAAAAGAQGVVSGDLSTIAGARTLADEVNKLGRFDAVIHNAGIGYREGRVEMEPGVPSVFAVNVLAPYILTALVSVCIRRGTEGSNPTSSSGESGANRDRGDRVFVRGGAT